MDMGFKDFLTILWNENSLYTFIYAVYALIVCTTCQIVQYNVQNSEINFSALLIANSVLFIVSVLIFIFTLVGFWFAQKIFGSELAFAYFCTALQFGSLMAVSITLLKRSGVVLDSPTLHSVIPVILLTAPIAGIAALITALSNSDFR